MNLTLILLAICCIGQSTYAEEVSPNQAIPKLLMKKLSGSVPLNAEKTVFVNTKQKTVDLLTRVNLRDGLLEMLCCPSGTKEHESILVIDSKAFIVHTALLSIGAKPGEPVRFDPEYIPPQGEKLQLIAHWVNQEGKLETHDVKRWIRSATRRYFVVNLKSLPSGFTFPEECDLKYDSINQELFYYGVMSEEEYQRFNQLSSDKSFRGALSTLYHKTQPTGMNADWVFVGSQTVKDPHSIKNLYLAEAGDLICVANFSSATIDVSIKSSASDTDRGFESNPDHIPALGTPILLRIQREVDVKTGK